MKNITSIPDQKIIEIICNVLNFPIITFDENMIEKKYIYPVYPKHIFVVETLNMLGMPIDKANSISKDNAVSYHDKALWCNKEVFNFVKEELVSKLEQ